jgi:hypothetical protein
MEKDIWELLKDQKENSPKKKMKLKSLAWHLKQKKFFF